MKFTLGTPNEITVTTHIDDCGDIDLKVDGIPVLYIRSNNGIVVPYCISGDDADRLTRYGFKLANIGGGKVLTRYEAWPTESQKEAGKQGS